MNLMRLATVPMLVTAIGAAAGCGNADSSAATAPGTKKTTTTASSTPASGATAVGSGGITIAATEFAFAPKDLTAAAGKVKLTLENRGRTQHELIVLKTDVKPQDLPVSAGRVSEKTSVGEIWETEAGATATHTFALKPGRYVLVCNLPGHFQGGMYGSLTVK